MSDPEKTHMQDQSLAAFAHIGACLARMYKELREEMNAASATQIVGQYARGLGKSQGERSRGRDQ